MFILFCDFYFMFVFIEDSIYENFPFLFAAFKPVDINILNANANLLNV